MRAQYTDAKRARVCGSVSNASETQVPWSEHGDIQESNMLVVCEAHDTAGKGACGGARCRVQPTWHECADALSIRHTYRVKSRLTPMRGDDVSGANFNPLSWRSSATQSARPVVMEAGEGAVVDGEGVRSTRERDERDSADS